GVVLGRVDERVKPGAVVRDLACERNRTRTVQPREVLVNSRGFGQAFGDDAVVELIDAAPVAVEQQDSGALPGACEGYGAADSAGRAGDEDDAPFEPGAAAGFGERVAAGHFGEPLSIDLSGWSVTPSRCGMFRSRRACRP